MIRMRRPSGFTLIELVITLTIASIIGAIVLYQGRSARQNVNLAQSAFELTLRMSGLRARALSEAKDYLLVVANGSNPAACATSSAACGKLIVLRSPQPGFTLNGFTPDPPVNPATQAEWVDSDPLPLNSQLALATAWTAPLPFNAVTAWDPTIMSLCAGGRACFGIRFRSTGEVTALWPAAPAVRSGFAFVLSPVNSPSGAADRRAIFVSFPTGLVKTAAF